MPSARGYFSSNGSGFSGTFIVKNDKYTFTGYSNWPLKFNCFDATLDYPNLEAITSGMPFNGSVTPNNFRIKGSGGVTICGALAVPVAGSEQKFTGTGNWVKEY